MTKLTEDEEGDASLLAAVKMSSDGGGGSVLKAARSGNLSKLQELLDHNPELLSTCNANGLNALHLSAKEGHVEVVKELINRGINVNAGSKKGNTPLHIAALAGHMQIVEFLVDVGHANVNVQSDSGFTPLYMSAQENHLEVTRYLLVHGADLNLSTAEGFTPLAVALRQRHDKVVALLLEHDSHKGGKNRLPALHNAAKKDDFKAATLLLNTEGANPNQQSETGFTALHIAAHYGAVATAKILHERGADVNFQAKNNITPLHIACHWGRTSMVQFLIENGAAINAKTRDGLTPMHSASRRGNDKAVVLLLTAGANFSLKTRSGLTALHMAAQGDHEDVAREIIKWGANVDEPTSDYLTALHVAAHCGNIKVTRIFLNKNADPNSRALNGFTPLHIACKKNRKKIVELLLQHNALIDTTTESGLTPLHVASFMGFIEVVAELLSHNADPNTSTTRGEGSLHLATRSNQFDVVRMLLRNGAKIDSKARENQTCLHVAARLGNADMVLVLLENGATVDTFAKDNYTALHIAAKEGHEDVVTVLLLHGAHIDVLTKKGFTALHLACKYGKYRVVKILLEKGANPNLQDYINHKVTPLHLAAHYNHADITILLLKEGKSNPNLAANNGYTSLHVAAKRSRLDIATSLIEFGANPDSASKNGFTPLHLASQDGFTDIVCLLLDNKANVNSQANNGLNSMHLAAQEDRIVVARLLVQYGMKDLDSRTKAGYTPLHTACHFGQLNMIKFLLEHGAGIINLNARTEMGYTPLHLAAQQGHLKVVMSLLECGADPNCKNNNGWTAAHVARRQHYLNIFEVLRKVTTVVESWEEIEEEIMTMQIEAVRPDTNQEHPYSESDEETGGSLASDTMRRKPKNSSCDDHLDIKEDIETSMTLPHTNRSAAKYKLLNDESNSLSVPRKVHHSSFRISASNDYLLKEMNYITSSKIDSMSAGGSVNSESMLCCGDDGFQGTQDTDNAKYIYTSADFDKDLMDDEFAESKCSEFRSMNLKAFPSHTLPFNPDLEFAPDNVPIQRRPLASGFLVSFLVDARGGAMRGSRYPGLRIVVPPAAATGPTRVTCRVVRSDRLTANMKPPLNDGEGLACRILEMGPNQTQFNCPVLLEIPYFCCLNNNQHELVIMRSENGEVWKEHTIEATEQLTQEILSAGKFDGTQTNEELKQHRIARVVTNTLPLYFALITRHKQECSLIGVDGGSIKSTVNPLVEVTFPADALTKRIKVGLQVTPISSALVAKKLGNRVAVTPVVTIEPRRRKFHKPIKLSIPLPKAFSQGMINSSSQQSPGGTLRLMCSITGGTSPAVWEDITGSSPLTIGKDSVSFTSTVSARFMLMDTQNIAESAEMTTMLYREACLIPYMGKFVLFAKPICPVQHGGSGDEAQLRCFCITDDKVDKTLECQEGFELKAASPEVEVYDGKPCWLEMSNSLIPMTKTGEQFNLTFHAFRENRLGFVVRLKDREESQLEVDDKDNITARVAFMREPRQSLEWFVDNAVTNADISKDDKNVQKPICTLELKLSRFSSPCPTRDGTAVRLSGGDHHRHHPSHHHHPMANGYSLKLECDEDTIAKSELNLRRVADDIGCDWLLLGQELRLATDDLNDIRAAHHSDADKAYAVLNLWMLKNPEATGNDLAATLRAIGREDVVKGGMNNFEFVTGEQEKAEARVRIRASSAGSRSNASSLASGEHARQSTDSIVEFKEQPFDEQPLNSPSKVAPEKQKPKEKSHEASKLSEVDAGLIVPEISEPRLRQIVIDGQTITIGAENEGKPLVEPLTSKEKQKALTELIGCLDNYLPEPAINENIAQAHSLQTANAPPVNEDVIEASDRNIQVYCENQPQGPKSPPPTPEQLPESSLREEEEEEKVPTESSEGLTHDIYEHALPHHRHHEIRETHEIIEGVPQEHREVEELEEIQPDGSIVKKSIVRTQIKQQTTEKHVTEGYTDSGHTPYDFEASNNSTELSSEPREILEEEEYDETLPDGTVVRKHVTRKRIVREVVRQIEITEPECTDNTENSETLSESRHETEDLLPDGTRVKKTVVIKQQRCESVDEPNANDDSNSIIPDTTIEESESGPSLEATPTSEEPSSSITASGTVEVAAKKGRKKKSKAKK